MQESAGTKQLDLLFNALSNSKRRNMIDLLSLRPATVKQLAKDNSLTLPAMHKHTRVLEDAGLIIRKKIGRTNFIALNKKSLGHIGEWAKKYHTAWGNDKETLDNYIASMQ